MWIWELRKLRGRRPRPRSPPAPTPPGSRPCSSRAPTAPRAAGRSSTPRWSQALHANGLRVCAWQFVYGNDPLGRGRARRRRRGRRRRLPGDRRREPVRGQVRRRPSSTWARCAPPSARAYPIGLTSFPYVDYHPRLPYSVFLGPGGAQANLPQVYWKDIGGTVDAVSGHTLAHNRIYGVADRAARPDLRQPARRRTSRASARCGRPTARAGCRGGPGRRPATPSGARSPRRSRRSPAAARPGLAGAGQGQQGRRGRLAAAAPGLLRPGRDRHRARSTRRPTPPCATSRPRAACRSPATTDALTWQAVLALPVTGRWSWTAQAKWRGSIRRFGTLTGHHVRASRRGEIDRAAEVFVISPSSGTLTRNRAVELARWWGRVPCVPHRRLTGLTPFPAR